MNIDNFSLNNPDASYIGDDDPELDLSILRQDAGGVITNHNGLADALLSRNNDLYNSLKGDWQRTSWNKGHNILTTTGREGDKFYIRREQMNTEIIADRCKRYRAAAELGIPDPLAPIDDSGNLAYRWMELPDVIAIRISDTYFGGMPWAAIKRDRTLKAQFYKVVEREYNDYVCYPHGKLPIPVDVPYPTPAGTKKYIGGGI